MCPAGLLAACALPQHVPDRLSCLQLMVPRLLRHTTVPRRLHPTAQSRHLTQAAWPGPLLPTHRHQSLALLACTHLPTPSWAPTAQLRAPCPCTVSTRLRRCWELGCTCGSRAGCLKTAAEQLCLKRVLLPWRRASRQVQERPSVPGMNAAAWPTAPHSPGSTSIPLPRPTHPCLCHMAPPELQTLALECASQLNHCRQGRRAYNS